MPFRYIFTTLLPGTGASHGLQRSKSEVAFFFWFREISSVQLFFRLIIIIMAEAIGEKSRNPCVHLYYSVLGCYFYRMPGTWRTRHPGTPGIARLSQRDYVGPDLGLVWCRFVLGLPTDNCVISFRLANRNRTDNNFLFFLFFFPHEPSLFPHEPRFFSPRTEIFPHEPRFFPHEPRFFPHEPRFFPTNRDFFSPRSSLRPQGAGGHYRFIIGLANRNR